MKPDPHRRWALAALLIAAGAVTACAQFNHDQPNSPVAMRSVPAITPAPRVALVLGSGAGLTVGGWTDLEHAAGTFSAELDTEERASLVNKARSSSCSTNNRLSRS